MEETVGLLHKNNYKEVSKPNRVGPRGADSPQDFNEEDEPEDENGCYEPTTFESEINSGPPSPSLVPSRNSAFSSRA